MCFSGSEECLQPLLEARDLLESLAAEELKIYQSSERSRYIVRGPLLGRMELVRQLYANGMHKVPLKLGEHERRVSIRGEEEEKGGGGGGGGRAG